MVIPTLVESLLRGLVSDWAERGYTSSDGLATTSRKSLSCPSASNTHGDEVFAVFDESSGVLRYLPAEVEVPPIAKETLDMDEFASKNRQVGKCLTWSCLYWRGACQLGHFVSKIELDQEVTLQDCVIRGRCRWYAENGPKACGPCMSVRNLRFAPGPQLG